MDRSNQEWGAPAKSDEATFNESKCDGEDIGSSHSIPVLGVVPALSLIFSHFRTMQVWGRKAMLGSVRHADSHEIRAAARHVSLKLKGARAQPVRCGQT